MSTNGFKVVDDIPPVERSDRSSKYDGVWEAADAAKPKAIVVGTYETPQEAANRASYLRQVRESATYHVAQRGTEVLVKVISEKEAAEHEARAKAAAAKRAKTRAKSKAGSKS